MVRPVPPILLILPAAQTGFALRRVSAYALLLRFVGSSALLPAIMNMVLFVFILAGKLFLMETMLLLLLMHFLKITVLLRAILFLHILLFAAERLLVLALMPFKEEGVAMN